MLANLAQWYFVGPNFLGMSGVVYGLLGYIWIRGKLDPSSGLFLHQQTVLVMMIWFFACWFQVIPIAIANYAHTGGLVVGMLWGFASSFWSTDCFWRPVINKDHVVGWSGSLGWCFVRP